VCGSGAGGVAADVSCSLEAFGPDGGCGLGAMTEGAAPVALIA